MLQQKLPGDKKVAMRFPPKSTSGARVNEMVCMLMLYISAQKHSVHDYFLPALSTPFLFTSIYQITSFHFHLFPFLLLFQVLKQCSHFNVNSGYADASLIPPLSFRTTFTQNPRERERGRKRKDNWNTYMFVKLFFHTICPLQPCKG